MKLPARRTLIGIAAVAVVICIMPAAASADLYWKFGVDERTYLRTLEMRSDAANSRIALGCDGKHHAMTVNGKILVGGRGAIRCRDIEAMFVSGGKGDDTIDMSGVSRTAGYRIAGGQDVGGHAINVDGGPGRDRLTGGPYGETFNWSGQGSAERPGRDLVDGGGGNDLIGGSSAADRLSGGPGNDWLEGGTGNDRLYGGPGLDRLDGNAGNDVLHGGAGKDYVLEDAWSGNNGNDRIYGEGGNDWLKGGRGNDLIDGGSGNDVMFGQKGADRLFGRAGNDWLFGGPGRDILRGGPGKNRIRQ